MTVHKAQSLLSLIAAAGLLVLTIATAVRPRGDGQFWHVLTIIFAWVAILATAVGHRTGDAPRAEQPAPVAAPPPPAPTSRANESSAAAAHGALGGRALVEFARELHGTLQGDRLHQLIARRLPAFVGRRDAWVVARFGARQHIITPSEAGGARRHTRLTDDVRQWITFPMKVDGQAIGVLGVGLHEGGLSDREHHVLATVAEFVGQSLATVNAFELMREASLVDLLTGCVTRPEGLRRCEAELRRADRTGTALAVVMMDLDHFKSVNDRFGHNAGDAVLSRVGEMLLKTLRASDIRCRWGGEEFLLVLPDSTVDRARRACEALRQRIENAAVRTSGHLVQITASIGITLTQPGEADIQKLLARADAALYHAKRQGRNRIEFAPGTADTNATAFAAGRAAPPPARLVPVDSSERRVDRRDPSRPDRRSVPSPGRRRSDPGMAAEPWRA